MKRGVLSAVIALTAAPLLMATAPTAPGAEADRAADWLVKPNEEQIAKAYPDRARRLEKTGQALITCTVSLDTTLQRCKVVSETPEGYGFGLAALDLASEMRLSPEIRGGVPVESLVNVPLAFELIADPEPAAPDFAGLPFWAWMTMVCLVLLFISSTLFAFLILRLRKAWETKRAGETGAA